MLQVFSDRAMAGHEPGQIEDPSRLGAVLDVLEARADVIVRAVDPATLATLSRVHDPNYVAALIATAGTSVILDPDTRTSSGSIEAALLAAGAARGAALATIDGPDAAFAVVRPPGHHACRGRAMGFCLFNNVAVAAAAAIADRGVERVLIVDWDVHHGNGTEDVVRGRDDILLFSTHQGGGGFYPGTGLVSSSNALNVPLPAGAGDAQLIAAFDDILTPAAADFRPDLVLVSAGFDAHAQDPLAGLVATTRGFVALAERVRRIADEHAGGRVALVLEGGYDLDALGSCAAAMADVFG